MATPMETPWLPPVPAERRTDLASPPAPALPAPATTPSPFGEEKPPRTRRVGGERADVHPVHGRVHLGEVARRQRARRGARRPRRPDPRLAGRRRAPPAGRRPRLLARARLHRVLPQPLQPAADRPARRRPGDGG